MKAVEDAHDAAQLEIAPVGSIVPFMGSLYAAEVKHLQPKEQIVIGQFRHEIEERGWMIADGRELRCSEYPKLFQRIGYTYGGDNDKEIFELPNLQDQFLRGTQPPPANEEEGGAGLKLVGVQKRRSIGAHRHQVGRVEGQTNKDIDSGELQFYTADGELKTFMKHFRGEMVRPVKGKPWSNEEFKVFTKNGFLFSAYEVEAQSDAEAWPDHVTVHYLIRVK